MSGACEKFLCNAMWGRRARRLLDTKTGNALGLSQRAYVAAAVDPKNIINGASADQKQLGRLHIGRINRKMLR
jgi:hypothetical protein